MTKVTFKSYITAGTFDSIYVNGNVVYGTDFYSEPINMTKVDTSDGGSVVYYSDNLKFYGKIIIKGVSKSEGEALKKFIEEKLVYFAKYLGLETDNSEINIGLDSGVAIEYANGARLEEDSGKGIAGLKAPSVYEIRLNYSFIKP